MMRTVFLLVLAAGLVCGQGPRGPLTWWDSPLVSSLDLTDSQTKQIRSTVAEYRDKLRDLRLSVNKAEGDLENIFNEDPVDQRKANEAIDGLAAARGELTKTISQMDLKLRLVLTPEQWQDLRSQMGRGARAARREGSGARGTGGAATKARGWTRATG